MEVTERKLIYTKCPACGSTFRFFETLTNEAKAQNMGRPEWKLCMQVHQGINIDPQKEKGVPLGGKVAGHIVVLDFCMDCGCVYVIEAQVTTVVKHLTQTPMQPPQRLMKPPFNNPRAS